MFRFDVTFSGFFLRILLDGSDGILMVGLVGLFGWVDFCFVFFGWGCLGSIKILNIPAMYFFSRSHAPNTSLWVKHRDLTFECLVLLPAAVKGHLTYTCTTKTHRIFVRNDGNDENKHPCRSNTEPQIGSLAEIPSLELIILNFYIQTQAKIH